MSSVFELYHFVLLLDAQFGYSQFVFLCYSQLLRSIFLKILWTLLCQGQHRPGSFFILTSFLRICLVLRSPSDYSGCFLQAEFSNICHNGTLASVYKGGLPGTGSLQGKSQQMPSSTFIYSTVIGIEIHLFREQVYVIFRSQDECITTPSDMRNE